MNPMTHPICLPRFLTGLLAIAIAFSAHGQDQGPSRRVDPQNKATGTQVQINEVNTDEFPKVRVFVTVLKDGVPVKGLGALDFRVREDEVDQEPLTVEPKLPPLSVVITMDTSGSMSKRLKDAQAAAISFLDLLGETDSAQVVSFARDVKKLSAMTTSRSVLREGILKTVARGDTALYDALFESLTLLKDRLGRKAIVLLSDGVDDDGSGRQLSKHSIRDVLDLARTVNVPVYVVGVGTELDEATLAQVAGHTGGLYLKTPQASQLKQLYGQIGEQLAGQYSIRYTSNLPADGTNHRLVLSFGGVRDSKDFLAPLKGPPSPPPPPSLKLPSWVPQYPETQPTQTKIILDSESGTLVGVMQLPAVNLGGLDAIRNFYREIFAAREWKGGSPGGTQLFTSPDGQRWLKLEGAVVPGGPPYVPTISFVDRVAEPIPYVAPNAPSSNQVVSHDKIPAWVSLYPEARPERVKVTYDPESRKIIGGLELRPAVNLGGWRCVCEFYESIFKARGWTAKGDEFTSPDGKRFLKLESRVEVLAKPGPYVPTMAFREQLR